MLVIKRDGRKESVKFDKITARIEKLSYGLNTEFVKTIEIAKKVIDGLYDGVSTQELDELASETAATLTTKHPDFATLAARIAVSNLHKTTSKSFSSTMKRLYTYVNPKTGENASLLSKEVYGVINKNAALLDSSIIYDRDFSYDYFGFKTLEKSYLLRLDGKVVERPQHMLMRVAIGIHMDDMDSVLETYNLLSEKWFTHATPTLFNAGTPKPQLSSCFLLTMKEDSIDGIYDTLKQCAKISQSAGGIGLSIHNVRATGSYIKGTNGVSNGIIPMLRNFDMTARYVDQGGGKRKGSFAIYLEPWHSDIFEFLQLKKNHGKEELRARDLFYAMWIPDLFMKRVESNSDWSLFSPDEAKDLHETYGEEFEKLYEKFEKEGKARKTVKAQDLWFEILEAQIETGNPYILYKDACNIKSNQKNLGTIKSSNLCTEIVEYTSPDEVAVCNLASIALNKFVKDDMTYDHKKLYEITKVITRNLNKVIDVNYYPVEEARNSNMRHRPIGIGVQGLADTFILMRHAFDSPEAKKLNEEIFETLYFGAMEASMEIAKEEGTYKPYAGSPGEFIVVKKHLLKDLIKLNLWNESMKDRLMEANGSIQGIKEIPDDIKLLYRTVWEVSQKSIIDMAADRGAYICQSQSMNIHMQDANFGKLTSMHFHAWKKGLKTGLYYLRTKAAADAIKFTIVKDEKSQTMEDKQAAVQCSIDNQDDCEMCGS